MTDTWSERASAVKSRHVRGSNTMSIGSEPTDTVPRSAGTSGSTTATWFEREHATYTRPLSGSTVTPSGSRPTWISDRSLHPGSPVGTRQAPCGVVSSLHARVSAERCPGRGTIILPAGQLGTRSGDNIANRPWGCASAHNLFWTARLSWWRPVRSAVLPSGTWTRGQREGAGNGPPERAPRPVGRHPA